MPLRDYIVQNLWLKLFSLVLAMLIWFVIQANFTQTETRFPYLPSHVDTTRDFRRPVIVMTSAANRRLFQVEPTEVSVKVRGDAALVDKLAPEDVQVCVKLMDVTDPQGPFLVDVTVPRDVSVQSILPAHVMVKPLNSK